MTDRPTTNVMIDPIVGVGMSSAATADEVALLVTSALAEHGLALDAVTAIATRERFRDDPRLRLGPPVVAVDDTALVAASPPCERTIGLPAHVAETAAVLVSNGRLLAPARRSAHVTVAVAVAAPTAGTPPPGPHGGDAARVAEHLGLDPSAMIDLSASMNPFAPDTTSVLRDILSSAPGVVTRYPDPAAAETALAAAIGIDPALLVLTNGGAEAIALVAREVGSGDVVEPEFSLYRRHLGAVVPGAPRWRSNPSNPLGRLAAPHERAGVWDEAFYPIATGRWTRGDSAAWRLGSLTKLWNCPGLRLGYVIAPDPVAAGRIRRQQPQWAVNGLALAALPELLDRTELARWHAELGPLRTELVTALASFGCTVHDTDANWVLVEWPDLRARLAPKGVLVRDCTSFGLPGTFRIAVPRRSRFDHVVSSLAACR